MFWWLFLLCPIAYLIGSFNVAKTVTKMRRVDLSKVGSGNAGATNVGRAMGFKWFLLVTILECLKCASVAVIGYLFVSFYNDAFTFYQNEHYIVILAMGLSAVFGAIFPVWYGFKGGKGLATLIGMAVVLNPLVMLIVFAICIPLLALTRIMSVSTLLGVIGWASLSLCFDAPLIAPVITLYCACVVLLLFSHRSNIARLCRGKEHKFTFKKKQPTTNAVSSDEKQTQNEDK